MSKQRTPPPNTTPPESVEVELFAMAHGGSAIGRAEGRTIFIPYTLPGERVRARITAERGRVWFGEGTTLLEASVDRIYPECPHFGPGRCGRCQWQFIAYEAQLLLKQDILADQLGRVGGFDDATLEAALRPTLRSPLQWGYASNLSFLPTKDGLALASNVEGRAQVIEVCHILHPDLLPIFDQFALEDANLQRVKLARGTDGQAMLILSIADPDDVPELEVDFPFSVNILLPDNTPVNLIGDLWLTIEAGGRRWRANAGSYVRANHAQLVNLMQVVREALDLRGGEAVLDLYGGIGFFSAVAAERAGAVTLVESHPPAASDARHNLADLEGVTVIQDSAENVVQAWAGTLDRIILDPPPDGLSLTVIDGLAALRPKRIVYVSSDPATLARDAQRLVRHGYRLTFAQPIDLSPQTYYIDAVAVLDLA
jgi:tRNA/tmRNA/rRNA uracil-C5-methylase (TrmA/RlmC/RlmD family)